MAIKNNEPQGQGVATGIGTGAYRRDNGRPGVVPPPIPVPPIPVLKPLSVESTDQPAKTNGESTTNIPPLHFIEVGFSGFEPNDGGGASLFRLWKGSFNAARSDGENFQVSVSFKQSDTPYVTGPMVEEALATLMEYKSCACKPSTKSVCVRHGADMGEGA